MMGFKRIRPLEMPDTTLVASYLYMDTSRSASTVFEKLIGNVVVVLTGRQAMKIVNHAIFSPLIRGIFDHFRMTSPIMGAFWSLSVLPGRRAIAGQAHVPHSDFHPSVRAVKT